MREEYIQYIYQVLQKLKEVNLIITLEKYEQITQKVNYLRYMIESGILRIDLDKVKVVEEQPTPEKLKDIRGFLGLTNFYRSLIKGYGKITKPLTNLTRKEEGFK